MLKPEDVFLIFSLALTSRLQVMKCIGLVIVLTYVLGCCTASEPSHIPPPPRVIGVTCQLCTTVISLFTQSMIRGVSEELAAQNASSAFTLKVINVATNNSAAYVAELASVFVREQLDHIITSQSLSPAVFRAAAALPDMYITMVDPGVVPDSLANRTQVIALRDEQVGYLAGLLAGSQTELGVVGFIGGPQSITIRNMRAGFYSGVLLACPSCAIVGTYLSAFSASAINTTGIVSAMLELGPDVVWCASGSAGSESLRKLAQAGVNVIGVDADEYTTTFSALHGTDAAARLLASSVKRTDVAARAAMRSYIATQQFSPTVRTYGAEQNCIELSHCHESCGAWSERTHATLNLTINKLRSGLSRIEVDTSTGALTALGRSALVSHQPTLLRINSGQQMELPPDAVSQTVLLWRRVLIFSGVWSSIILYDDLIVSYERVLVVRPPPSAPVLGDGYTLTAIAVPSSAGMVDVAMLFGGVQNGDVANASFVFSFTCGSFLGLCTSNGTWSVASTQSAPTLRHHAAAGRASNVWYVAGGVGPDGAASSAVWRVTTTLLPASGLYSSAWQRLSGSSLWRPLHDFSLAVWPPAPSTDEFLIAAGGEARGIGWLNVSQPNASWNVLPAIVIGPRRPCVYTADESTILIVNTSTAVHAGYALVYLRLRSSPRPVTFGALAAGSVTASALLHRDSVTCTCISNTGASSPIGPGGTFDLLFVLPTSGAASTRSVVTVPIPDITCDGSRRLYRSDDLSFCVLCASDVRGDECAVENAGGEGPQKSPSAVIAVAVVAAIFALGLSVGVAVLYRWRNSARSRRRAAAAPLNFPVVICFVNIVRSHDLWRTKPRKAADNVRRVRRVVEWLADAHDCYEVRSVGDSVLLVCQDPAHALRFAVGLLDAMQKSNTSQAVEPSWWRWLVGDCTWPPRVRARVVLHAGRPTVSCIDGGSRSGDMFDYSGDVVDAAIAARLAAAGDQVAVSDSTMELLRESSWSAEESGLMQLAVKEVVAGTTRPLQFNIFTLRNGIAPPDTTGCRPADATAGPSVPCPGTVDDRDVEMPNFPPIDDDAMSARAGGSLTAASQLHNRHSGVSLGAHLLGARGAQKMTQYVTWVLETVTMSMEPAKRAKFLRALCHNYGVALPASSEASPHDPDSAGVSVGGFLSSNRSLHSSLSVPLGTTSKLAAAMLQQLDSLELRALLLDLVQCSVPDGSATLPPQ